MIDPRKVIRPGVYLTREGKSVTITRIVGERAYGCFPDSEDYTWWYSATGHHAVYLPDDLVKRIDSISNARRNPTPPNSK